MSKPRPDLPNDRESAMNYVDYLVKTGLFTHIFLQGSRSPKHSRKPTKKSDWDFYLVAKDKKTKITDPRKQGRLHACIAIGDDVNGGHISKIELYPVDHYSKLEEEGHGS